MIFELRDYQKESCEQAWKWIKESTEPCVMELCTAAGKSFILAELAHRINKQSGKKVLVLAPTAEIVKQNREKYLLTGEPASLFSASVGKCLKHDVIFGSPLTVKNGINAIKNNVAAVFIDECHILGASIKNIVADIKKENPSVRVIGVTGTPYRLGSGYIYQYDLNGNPVSESECRNPYFNKLVCSVKTRTLIDMGFLSNPICGTAIESYDTANLKKASTGLYTSSSVNDAFVGKGRKTASIISQVLSLTENRMCCMIFASTVRHASEIMESLPPLASYMVTGETKKADREIIINKARAMEVSYLVSVGTLTTGVDIPCVDTVAILRATESVGLFQQIIGRGLRLHDYKNDCLILDFAENVENHCPDGDLFNPEIKAVPPKAGVFEVKAICPLCDSPNIFAGRPNPDEFEIDHNGYFIDLMGEEIKTEDGLQMPAHFGRRCYGQQIIRGVSDRCEYRWTSKECPDCSHHNDIAARECEECKFELVDPNEKLQLEHARIKANPYEVSSDVVLSWRCTKHISKAGNDTLRIAYTTDCRSFDVWYLPQRKRLWNDLCMAVYGKPAPDVDTFLRYVNRGNMPTTVTVSKDDRSKFFTVYGHNREAT